ncbi:glycoside hydrolase family 97 protein [Botryobacter ruber]|uniref:glycoside hydrolase family 97 protein n=1 Tax=Botryobacter ruber TaxID=2171629 RepID=UPI000E0B4F98|nr:glycoside hydrolase family 97 protein [Botryobacter ruber]
MINLKSFQSLALWVGITIGFSACALTDDTTIISSPDGNVRFRLNQVDSQLVYTITFKDQPVIEASPLVMTIDNKEITNNVQPGKTEQYEADETYAWHGAHAEAVNKYKGARIALKQNDGLEYTLDVRVFNDAASFRLIVPGAENEQRVPDETTAFKLPEGSTIWYHDLHMHYESVHTKNDIAQVKPGEWMAPPVTFKLPEGRGYAAITEADLKNYSGMALQSDSSRQLVTRLAHHQPTSYPYELRYSKEDVERLIKPAAVTGTITTPWRVVMVGADLNAMANNDAVANLNPAPDKELFPQGIHTDWIRPGRAVWKYLDGGGDGTLAVMKEFSKQAGELGYEHNILEGFWSRWTDEEIRELVDYSNQQKVGVWLWKHSKSLRDDHERLAFFKRCQDLGITGVKLDFFDHEAKEVIDLYRNILRETAEHKLLVDFHGANKPTGEARTWPNEVTREAVKGMEASKLEDRATHNTTVPFTRWLAGHAEYTPVHFGERRKNTTWAHQVASAAIMSTPLLTYAATPANILANPSVEMMKSIPSTWDETIVLPASEIGEVAAFARRKGDTWFLAIMNGVNPKTISIPLSFLGQGNYETLVVKDDQQESGALRVENVSQKKDDTLQLDLVAGGGYVARYTSGSTRLSSLK